MIIKRISAQTVNGFSRKSHQLTILQTLRRHKAQSLMERFWPGPLTLILPKSSAVPLCVSAAAVISTTVDSKPILVSPPSIIPAILPRQKLNDIARHLFAALRYFDDTTAEVIYTEAFPNEGIGRAVANRLNKAAARLSIILD